VASHAVQFFKEIFRMSATTFNDARPKVDADRRFQRSEAAYRRKLVPAGDLPKG
jgi:hypothetical protein